MNAARLHSYNEALKLDEVDEPKVDGPLDVIVRIGAAGLCRTDLHIQEGQWAEKSGVQLPYTPGHENAGWVHEVGSAVSNVEVGDTVIVHPFISCGLCGPCRAGDDMHCLNGSFPGIDRDGGFADFLQTSARSVVKLDPSLDPKEIAALADAGLTAIHAIKKAIPVLSPGTRAVVIGAGGLGHIGIQCLKAMTPAEVIVIDPSEAALRLAREVGADHTVLVDGTHVEKVRAMTADLGAAGCCVLSGLAVGIDAAAHEGALSAGAPTIGSLGGGHARFFPRRNRGLAARMVAQGGAVLSPFPPDHDVRPGQFIARNGVVAALADAVVVIGPPMQKVLRSRGEHQAAFSRGARDFCYLS